MLEKSFELQLMKEANLLYELMQNVDDDVVENAIIEMLISITKYLNER